VAAPEVAILDGTQPILTHLRGEDGNWLVPDLEPLVLAGAPTSRTVAAVIDTGVIAEHPSLVGRIVEEVDLTGEGVEDQHGHGTAVAAILAATAPTVDIISVKALDRTGRCNTPTLALAFREAARLLGSSGSVVNVSAGIRQPACRGDCALCATVTELQSEGYIFVCAAGNSPGVTYCPAKVGIAVTTPAPWAAPGSVVTDAPQWRPSAPPADADPAGG
jgi:subtilisin family serine protease